MSAGLILFEDRGWGGLRPLTDTLPVPALAFGASSLGERWRRTLGLPLLAIEARAQVMAAWPGAPAKATPPPSGDAIAVLAAAQPGDWAAELTRESAPAAWYAGDRLIAARAPLARLAPLIGAGEEFAARLAELELPRRSVEARVADFPWHLIEWNPAALTADLGRTGGIAGDVHASAVLLNPARIQIAAGARVDPLAVLDARNGAIAIQPRAVIQAHTLVIGPCVVGEGTQLLGGVIGGSTIGPECRLAGEIEASIWQGYANKRHHGFIGHSLIGEWVNLGALTTTSDLKNNYGSVRMWVDGQERDSGSPKIGSVIGAHVKTGIGSLLPTGASVGVGANLFGGGRFAPKYVPAFAWWDGETLAEHELEKFLATARVAMSRRGRELSGGEERWLRSLAAEAKAAPAPRA
jgi:UDP-N-acetylglucosamine diphosphorylase/glucosamine-1-phosphate N-acetyltransferase